MSKTKSIHIRVTEKELAKLKRIALAAGVTVSAFLLQPALKETK